MQVVRTEHIYYSSTNTPVKIVEEQIEDVTKFQYLGSITPLSKDGEDYVKVRIRKALYST